MVRRSPRRGTGRKASVRVVHCPPPRESDAQGKPSSRSVAVEEQSGSSVQVEDVPKLMRPWAYRCGISVKEMEVYLRQLGRPWPKPRRRWQESKRSSLFGSGSGRVVDKMVEFGSSVVAECGRGFEDASGRCCGEESSSCAEEQSCLYSQPCISMRQ
jgi:hypothetical protein